MMPSAGHYYSYIRARHDAGDGFGQWFRFDDTKITEWSCTDEEMAAQFFGGKYAADATWSTAEHERYWSAYVVLRSS